MRVVVDGTGDTPTKQEVRPSSRWVVLLVVDGRMSPIILAGQQQQNNVRVVDSQSGTAFGGIRVKYSFDYSNPTATSTNVGLLCVDINRAILFNALTICFPRRTSTVYHP
jgi:hypothetical protein